MRKIVLCSLLFTAIAFYFVLTWYGGQVIAQKTMNDDALYSAQCAKCHGADGKGLSSLPDIPDFTDAKWQTSRSDQQIADSINNGGRIMPGFKDTLSTADIQALVKQVRAFWSGKKPKKKS